MFRLRNIYGIIAILQRNIPKFVLSGVANKSYMQLIP